MGLGGLGGLGGWEAATVWQKRMAASADCSFRHAIHGTIHVTIHVATHCTAHDRPPPTARSDLSWYMSLYFAQYMAGGADHSFSIPTSVVRDEWKIEVSGSSILHNYDINEYGCPRKVGLGCPRKVPDQALGCPRKVPGQALGCPRKVRG